MSRKASSAENCSNASAPPAKRRAASNGTGALLGLLAASLCVGWSPALAGDESAGESTLLEDLGPEKFNALGEHTTGIVCTQCHGWTEIVDGPRQTPEQWDFIVSSMIARGSNASPDQVDIVRRYLKWVWGVVSVNRASAEDIAAVTGLPAEQAEALVAYREENGPFSDLESLKQVPGVDAAILDSRVDAIMFY